MDYEFIIMACLISLPSKLDNLLLRILQYEKGAQREDITEGLKVLAEKTYLQREGDVYSLTPNAIELFTQEFQVIAELSMGLDAYYQAAKQP